MLQQCGGPVLEALGLSQIVVDFPCTLCDHAQEAHAGGACTGLARFRSEITETGETVWDDAPCPCTAFAGAWPDGTPRRIALRELSWMEWIEVGKGLEKGVPLELGGAAPGGIDPKTWSWFRAIVARALVAVWIVDDAGGRWQPCRVEGQKAPAGTWFVGLEDLDRAGIMAKAAMEVVASQQRGGPFCGHYRGAIPEGSRGGSGQPAPDGGGVGPAPA